MKFLVNAALALFVIVGLVRGAPSAYPDVTGFNVNSGTSSEATTRPIYLAHDCDGIKSHFESNPIPLNTIDVDNGREIIGWEIICPDVPVVSGGTGTGSSADERNVPRTFGWIKLKYAMR